MDKQKKVQRKRKKIQKNGNRFKGNGKSLEKLKGKGSIGKRGGGAGLNDEEIPKYYEMSASVSIIAIRK